MLRILCIPHEGLPSSQSVCQEEELYTINYKTINYKTSILRGKGKCVCGLIQPLEYSWITDFISIKQICNFKTWNQDYRSAVILDLDSRISFLKTLDCAYVHQPSCGFISVLELCLPGFSFLALGMLKSHTVPNIKNFCQNLDTVEQKQDSLTPHCYKFQSTESFENDRDIDLKRNSLNLIDLGLQNRA